ncbi:hypothetical protein AKJ16_DCAP01249 [Drosera capensis]
MNLFHSLLPAKGLLAPRVLPMPRLSRDRSLSVL